MPKIKFDRIISFSSEDPVHVANNILLPDPAKKWKCKNPGEKCSTIVLQLEKASIISGIDIGNEHSAYIEVLVSRFSNDDEFKVLLVMSSFMSPVECRQSTNTNKVRMFKQDQLVKPECDEKWDRVKIVCTQPFNRHVQYGLSFITLHTPEENKTNSLTSLGKFTLRPASPDLTTGSLFAKSHQLKQQDENVSAATAIRKASEAPPDSPLHKPKIKHSLVTANKKQSFDENQEKLPPRNRDALFYNKEEEEPNDKIDKLIEKKLKEMKDKELIKNETPQKNNSLNNNIKNKTPKNNFKNDPSTSDSAKRKFKEDKNEVSKKHKTNMITKPFHQLLSNVVLVISGIQNPDRANLRTMALSMGAKYKADWDDTCTHLICAFMNTPKYNQVKGKGKIVTKKWIEECHSERKKIPWRRFALDNKDKSKDESEDEIWEETKPHTSIQTISDDEDEFEKDNASDTENEIERIQKKQQIKENDTVIIDPYDAETDEENIEMQTKDLTNTLPDFFMNKIFFIDVIFNEEEYNLLKKYITAYKGMQVVYPDGDIDICITKQENVENLKIYNTNTSFVTCDWVWACHNEQKLLPVDDYILN